MLLFTALKSESGGKAKGLFDREIREDDVILHDIGSILAECVHSDWVLVIKLDLSRDAHAWAYRNPIA